MMGELMEEELGLELESRNLPDFPYFMLGWAKYVKRGLVSSHSFPRRPSDFPFRSSFAGSLFCLAFGNGKKNQGLLSAPRVMKTG